jgi:hypothetical protein
MRNSIEYTERNSNKSTCILYHNLTAVTLSACLILIQVKGNICLRKYEKKVVFLHKTNLTISYRLQINCFHQSSCF